MTKIYIVAFFLLLALLNSACENEIPFNKEANPPKLTMNALINADSINNILYLNTSGQSVIGHVMDATVEIRVNGTLVETPKALPLSENQDEPLQKRFLITTRFHPGDLVRIDATTEDGLFHAWAEVIVPQPATIENLVIDTVKKGDSGGQSLRSVIRYRIALKDRPKEKNYYRLIIDRVVTQQGWATVVESDTNIYSKDITTVIKERIKIVTREDVVLTDGHPSLPNDDAGMFEQPDNIYAVFDDTRFMDSEYTMMVYNYLYSEPSSWPFPGYERTLFQKDIIVHLLSITEAEYYYLKALNLIDSDVYDETISEPIKIPGNVNGGLGIVSISTETSKLMTVSKYPK